MHHRNHDPQIPGRVVILGASGFIGSSLARHLTRSGCRVDALSSKDLDLRERASAAALRQRLDAAVLVIASALTPDRGKGIATFMTNLHMMETVCEGIQGVDLRQVIYLSSDAVYGEVSSPLQETSGTISDSLYGIMHLARETMLAQTVNRDTPLLILRSCTVYGPEDTHNSYGPNRFVRSALADNKISLFGAGEEMRDHIHVSDVVRLIESGLLYRSEGILNLCTGRSISFLQLAEMIARLAGKAVDIQQQPRSGAVTHRHFDNTLLIRAYPQFQFIPIETALSEMIAQLSSKAHG
jgi:nucleoside-diphosphate-sugar epimerase